MRAVVYSCCTGDYRPPPPAPPTPGLEFLLYTSDPRVSSPGWTTLPVLGGEESSVYRSRLPKIRVFDFLPDADCTLYVDARYEILRPAAAIAYGMSAVESIVASRHADRRCAYEELAAISRIKGIPREATAAREAEYAARGLPRAAGLWAPGHLFRKNDDAARRFCSAWWDEYVRWPLRDQPAFAAAAYFSGIAVGYFPGTHRTASWWRKTG